MQQSCELEHWLGPKQKYCLSIMFRVAEAMSDLGAEGYLGSLLHGRSATLSLSTAATTRKETVKEMIHTKH